MKIFAAILFLILSLHAIGQRKLKKELYYAFNKDWKSCPIDSATYLSYVEVVNDTTWQWNNYHIWGSLISVETYKDEQSTIPNGYFSYFNEKGKVDSCGNCINGLRNGKWLFFVDSLKPQFSRDYVLGKLIKEERSSSRETDNLEPGEKEATFPNGTSGWIRYLERYFRYPERAENKEISGTVYIYFTVNTEGKIESPFITKSVEFSIDKEAMRLMYNSPLWIPAEQKGHKVKAYRIQPIMFVYTAASGR